MAGTIIDYLNEYGDCPLAKMPLNDVDSLVLCQLSYLKFDGMVCNVRDMGPSISIKELAEHADFDNLFADTRFEKQNRELFQGLLSGRRFCNMRMNFYINIIEKEWETQFSAITFLLEDGTIYIAFRGTDETIVGWKEDFNMAYLSPVPAQSYSAKYLNAVTKYVRKPFYVGGHSKGGNLAIYSAMNCFPNVQKQILKIYNMDGPGFRPEVLQSCGYDKVEERVVKILPKSSLVGMILEKGIHYQVVESNRLGLAQHDPYSWQVENGRFACADDIYESRRLMDSAINEWILSLDKQQLRTFVDTMYEVVSASDADDLIEFTSDWRKSMNGIIAALKEVDEQTAEILKQIVRSLFEIAGKKVRRRVKRGFPLKRVTMKGMKKRIKEDVSLQPE